MDLMFPVKSPMAMVSVKGEEEAMKVGGRSFWV